MIADPDIERVAKTIHTETNRLGLLRDPRHWDRHVWKDGEWDCVMPGLTEDEKEKWRAVAEETVKVARVA